MPKLYLVDISSFVFRAYYAIKSLKTSTGISTNATYGVVNMMAKLIRDKKPDYLAVVFDSPVPSFRKQIYADYKANRQAPPEDLPAQFDHIKEFVLTYPLPHLEVPGLEADDLIATLAHQARTGKFGNEPLEVVIVSADKDLMQLIGPGITMYDSMKEKIIRSEEVSEKFGVAPEQVGDVLALMGDASDNIPGVEGIGGKTATKLIMEWGSLENLLEHAADVKGKIGENLKTHREMALLSRKLVSLVMDAPVDVTLEQLALKEPAAQALNDFYRKYELKTLVRDLKPAEATPAEVMTMVAPAISSKTITYDLVCSDEQLALWAKRLRGARLGFSFDTETTSVDSHRARLVGLSFADALDRACYIPLTHGYLGCPEQLPQEKVREVLQEVLADPASPKFAQNAKYDLNVLARHGFSVNGLAGDTLVASYLIDPEGSHGLDHLAQKYLNHQNISFSDVVPKGGTFDQVELEKACAYAGEDADITFKLVKPLHDLLHSQGLWDLYQNIEIPLVSVLSRMEQHGVLVDREVLKGLGREFSERLRTLEAQLFEHAGTTFNVGSPKQVAEILFVKLQLPTQRKTKTGYSTDVDVLTELAKVHPLPKLLLEHRMLSKLMSTYVDQLQNLIHPETKRIHTTYHQNGAATGRLSSSDPNLQNIPIRTEEGRRIREAFVAPPGCVILSADYSQIELRLLAAFSEDPELVKAFEEGEDIHALTAMKVFGKTRDEVTKQLRAMAKTVNFGILYGQGPFGLSQLLEISQGEAKKYIEGFYAGFPSVMAFKQKQLEEIRKTEMVRTWKGRLRPVPDINSRNNNLKMNAERTAFNTIFQGSAADLIKVAMINIDRKLSESFKARMVMQVHDELVFEVPEVEVDAVTELVRAEMEGAIECRVGLKVDIGVGLNWAKAH